MRLVQCQISWLGAADWKGRRLLKSGMALSEKNFKNLFFFPLMTA